MQSNKKIAVDAMGGDGGPSVIIPSVEKFLLKHNDVEAKIFGDSKIIEKYYNGMLAPGMALIFPSSYFPERAPRSKTPARAAAAPHR